MNNEFSDFLNQNADIIETSIPNGAEVLVECVSVSEIENKKTGQTNFFLKFEVSTCDNKTKDDFLVLVSNPKVQFKVINLFAGLFPLQWNNIKKGNEGFKKIVNYFLDYKSWNDEVFILKRVKKPGSVYEDISLLPINVENEEDGGDDLNVEF